MSVSWTQAQKWKSSGLDDAAEQLRIVRDDLVETGDSLAKVTLESWTGVASNSARKELGQFKEELEDRIVEVSAVRRALQEASDAVLEVEKAVAKAESFAVDNGLEIQDDQVKDVDGFTGATDDQEADLARKERTRLVKECADHVAKALRAAANADRDLGEILNGQVLSGALANHDYRTPEAAAKGGAALLTSEPSDDATPAQVKAWWDSLSKDQRAAVKDDHPEWIGNRDGIPATVRDEVNTALIEVYRSQVTARHDAIQNEIDKLAPGDEARREELEKALKVQADKLASMSVVEELGKRKDTLILGLDLSNERAQAIIANGNPDKADHVGVFTPGLTSTVQGMEDNVNSMKILRRRAQSYLNRSPDTRGDQVSTVTWLGYQAPQLTQESLANLKGDSVAMANAAKAGGDSLATFFQGIGAGNPDADITALGHSYGSTTTGYALQRSNTGVDRVAFFGSPGIGTNDVHDIKVPSGHVFYEEAKWDGVGDLERFGHDLSSMDGVTQLSTDESDVPSEGKLKGIVLHSEYLDEDTTSQSNLMKLLVGHEDKVVPAAHSIPVGEVLQDRATHPGSIAGAAAARALDDIPETLDTAGHVIKERAEQVASVLDSSGRKLVVAGAGVAADIVLTGEEARQSVNDGVGSIFDQLTRAASEMPTAGGLP